MPRLCGNGDGFESAVSVRYSVYFSYGHSMVAGMMLPTGIMSHSNSLHYGIIADILLNYRYRLYLFALLLLLCVGGVAHAQTPESPTTTQLTTLVTVWSGDGNDPVPVPDVTAALIDGVGDAATLTVRLENTESSPGDLLYSPSVSLDSSSPATIILDEAQLAVPGGIAPPVSWTAEVVVGDGALLTVTVATVTVTVNKAAPLLITVFDDEKLTLSLSESDDPMNITALVVARDVRDPNGRQITVTLINPASTPDNLFFVRPVETTLLNTTTDLPIRRVNTPNGGEPTASLVTETTLARLSGVSITATVRPVPDPYVAVFGSGSQPDTQALVIGGFEQFSPATTWLVPANVHGEWTATVEVSNGIPNIEPEHIPVTVIVESVPSAPRANINSGGLHIVTAAEDTELSAGVRFGTVTVARNARDPEMDEFTVSVGGSSVSLSGAGSYIDNLGSLFSTEPTLTLNADNEVLIVNAVAKATGRWTATVYLRETKATEPLSTSLAVVTIDILGYNDNFLGETNPSPSADELMQYALIEEQCIASGGTFTTLLSAQGFGGEVCQRAGDGPGIPLSLCRYRSGASPSQASPPAGACVSRFHDYDPGARPMVPYGSFQSYYTNDQCSSANGGAVNILDVSDLPRCQQDILEVCPPGQLRVLYDEASNSYSFNIFAPCRPIYTLQDTRVTVMAGSTEVPVPELTVANSVYVASTIAMQDNGGVVLTEQSNTTLFSVDPVLSLDASSGLIIMKGGVLNAGVRGVSRATVLLHDNVQSSPGTVTLTVGVVTVVARPNRGPTVQSAPDWAVAVSETDDEVIVPPMKITVARGLSDINNDELTLAVTASVVSESGPGVGGLLISSPKIVLMGEQGQEYVVVYDGTVRADWSGVWSVDISVHDGSTVRNTHASRGRITVFGVNDPPTYSFIAGSTSQTVLEDGDVGRYTILENVNDIDTADASLSVMLTLVDSTPVDLFAVNPTVELELLPGGMVPESDADFSPDNWQIVVGGGRLTENAHGIWTAAVELTDGTATVTAATMTIMVESQNDTPVYTLGQTVISAGASLPIPVLTVATGVRDVDGDALTASISRSSAMTEGGAPELFSTQPSITLTGTPGNQTILVASAVAISGVAGSWIATVELSDGEAMATVATVTIVADASNPEFDLRALTLSVLEPDSSSAVSLTVAALVRDPNGDMLTLITTGTSQTPGLFTQAPMVVFQSALDATTSIVVTGATVAANANGVWSTTVSIDDGTGNTVRVGAVTITVAALPDAPTFAPGNLVVSRAEPDANVPIDVLTVATNVRDADGDALTLSLTDETERVGSEVADSIPRLFVTQPTVTLRGSTDATRSIVVTGATVAENANGVWTATVDIGDGAGNTVRVGAVTITVSAVSDVPTFSLVSLSVDATETNDTVSIDVLTVATSVRDADGDSLTLVLTEETATLGRVVATITRLFASASTPTVALAGAVGNQSIELRDGVAQFNSNGVWTATVSVGDGTGNTVSVGVVTVSVTAMGDVPIFTQGSARTTVAEDTSAVPLLTVATSVRDIDGEALTVSLRGANAVLGNKVPATITQLFVTPPGVTLTGDVGDEIIELRGGVITPNANGRWTATVELSDSAGSVTVVTVVTVSVTAENDAPVFTRGTLRWLVDEEDSTGDLSLTIPELTVATGISDADGDSLTVSLTGEVTTPESMPVMMPVMMPVSETTPVMESATTPVMESATTPVVELFLTTPVVMLVGAAGNQSIVMNSNAVHENGVWTATVHLSDGVVSEEVGVLTVSIRSLFGDQFALSVPDGVTTIDILPGRIGGAGNASVSCLPSTKDCSGNGVVLTAYRGEGVCATRPSSYAEAAENCEPLEMTQGGEDGNTEILTLNYGGLFSVWWVGDSGRHQTVASAVAQYYAPPVLGMGEDITIPAGEMVTVTVTAGSYGTGNYQGDDAPTLTMALESASSTGIRKEVVMQEGAIAVSAVFENIFLNAGETMAAMLESSSFVPSTPLEDVRYFYTPGRTTMTIGAAPTANISEVRVHALLTACDIRLDNIPESLSCADDSSPEWVLSVAGQYWSSSPRQIEVAATVRWIGEPIDEVLQTTPGAMSQVTVSTITLSGEDNEVTLALRDADITGGNTLEVLLTRTTATNIASVVPITGRFPVVSTDEGLSISQPPLRPVFASEGQAVRLGLYGHRAGGQSYGAYDLSGTSVAVEVGTPPEYTGSPIYDFSVVLPQGQRHARVILHYPDGVRGVEPVYYKYGAPIDEAAWAPFITGANGRVYSSRMFPCPRAETAHIGLWTRGLTQGHRCVLLVIADDGNNDAAYELEGVVADPGAVVDVSRIVEEVDGGLFITSGGGGGSMLGYIGLFIVLLIVAAFFLSRRIRPYSRIHEGR